MGKKKNAVIIILLVLICIGIIVTVVFLSKNGDNTIKEGGSSELTKAPTEATTNPTTKATEEATQDSATAPTEAPTEAPTQAPTQAPTEQYDVIKHTNSDTFIMPDKYNTGAKGTLTESGLANMIGTIQFAAGNNGTANVLDFYYRNGDVEGEVVIENIDFSAYSTNLFNDAKVERNIKIIFNNCKFKSFAGNRTGLGSISFVFNNCSFVSFSGSNATFNKCSFAGSYSDGMNPFVNVFVNDCYIYDRSSADTAGAGKHTDGTQIYGYAGYDTKNISYKNCRFEMPAINMGENTAGINAPLMLQTEYSNGYNITFSDCTINGGGYSIYAHACKETSIDNILFKNIAVGGTMRFGVIYPDLDDNVVLDNIYGTKDLYVGSVWKDSNGTHISVSNDTLMDKMLAIYTDKGIFTKKIPACPLVDSATSFWEYPFDVDVVIPHDCKYVVCYDVTAGNNIKQLRFVNWTNGEVTISKTNKEKLASYSIYDANAALIEGNCGKNAKFSLSPDGVLTIFGSGDCENYHSGKLPPWQDYKAYINKIVVKEGVTRIGNQSFKGCKNLSEVVLPNGFLTIGARAFEGCSFITSITIPASVTEIANHAFNNVFLQKTIYLGTPEQWNQIVIGESNDRLVEAYEN
ncbi:MAG: hypothetical protein E7252_00640 [Lachnospira sp.]|nr:hypothetical protein [Lachnospira sp.]